MNELALFAGAGGGILGTRLLRFRPVCAVEISSYCREILLRRQEEGHLEPFPIWDDVRTFDGLPWRGFVDVVTAGFPCQPFSQAGKGKSENDHRNMWPETIRIIREVEPSIALLENVPGLTSKEYFGQILGEIAEAGFDAEWGIVSAKDVGACHVRKRLWIMAYPQSQRHGTWGKSGNILKENGRSNSQLSPESTVSGSSVSNTKNKRCRQRGLPFRKEPKKPIVGNRSEEEEYVPNGIGNGRDEGREDHRENDGDQSASIHKHRITWWDQDPADVSDCDCPRCLQQLRAKSSEAKHASVECSCGREPQPQMGRVVNGLANRVDQLRAIGNGQVPGVVAAAWYLLNK